MSNIGKLVDINKRKGLPRTYRFNQFARWFTLLLGSFALLYSIWFIFNKIEADTRFIHKLIPFLILFFTLNSVMKNLLSINSIRFQEDSIIFRFLARRNVKIFWSSVKKMSYSTGRLRAIKITYIVNEEQKVFIFPISFPNMLEIVNSMAEMIPNVEFDDFMQNVIISEKEKEHIRAYDKKQN